MPEIDLRAEFGAAAEEIQAEFRRRISGLRGRLRPSEITAARKVAKEWRAAAMEALRRDFANKRSAMRDREKERVLSQRRPKRRRSAKSVAARLDP